MAIAALGLGACDERPKPLTIENALTAEEIASENHFYKIYPASDGLVAYWKFDDNTKGKTVKDYTGNGFDLKTEREVNWQSVALPEE